MKFFILLLGIGLVMAQEETSTQADVSPVPTTQANVSPVPTTESSRGQVCDGRGELIARLGCTETCRRPWKFGELPIFTNVPVGAPCKTSRNSEQDDGKCEVSSRSNAFGVCKAN